MVRAVGTVSRHEVEIAQIKGWAALQNALRPLFFSFGLLGFG